MRGCRYRIDVLPILPLSVRLALPGRWVDKNAAEKIDAKTVNLINFVNLDHGVWGDSLFNYQMVLCEIRWRALPVLSCRAFPVRSPSVATGAGTF